ncbi:MAG: methionine--tRNA ligase [Candidatus Dormibacteraeota bacterium]|nr:methionine--tRNA ligase [Candidatus Dormibacteraeota bacterium]
MPVERSRRTYVTTTIPYVNASPHIGFALELVQADALARHRRNRHGSVRLTTGTDENSLSNVLAAEAEGVPVRRLVDRNADRFASLLRPLQIDADDFVRTSRDPRHAGAVEKLWRACLASGDLYRGRYEGLYCVRCERFIALDELQDGRCPDHLIPPEHVAEDNWFFRLSRHRETLAELIRTRRLHIQPVQHEQEVLSFIEAGLQDFSVSRSQKRARGWGIPVPDDPDQVVYVWFDALVNYLTALDYGTDGELYETWWANADRRIHVIGKNVIRFHALYWPAMLLSAGLPLPTGILVHQFLTTGGRKISKSLGNAIDPHDLVLEFGPDALRWWLLREPSPTVDTDFSAGQLVTRANDELANGFGNLVNRTVAMVHRYRGGRVPRRTDRETPLGHHLARLPLEVDEAIERFDLREAASALLAVVDEANALINRTRPWELAAAERAGNEEAAAALDDVLTVLVAAARALAEELTAFVPGLAGRIHDQVAGEQLAAAQPVFRRLPS